MSAEGRSAADRPGRAVHRLSLAIMALAAAACAGPGSRADTDPRYQRPGRQVELPDGRKLNLRCSGRGSPTVILESGFGADSQAWAKVQPDLARTTRVCAYDRAGYGFSDPGPLPRDGAAIARDLDAALSAAGIDGAIILVGHSAGGLYARLLAARRASDLAGLVLLDPTVERLVPPGAPDGLDGPRRRVRRCLALASSTEPPAAESADWSGCNAGRSDIQRRSATWEAQVSELDTLFNRTSAQVLRIDRLLRDKPIHVITASATVEANPSLRLGADESPWLTAHRALAAGSRYGAQRTVQSSHLVMIDRPDVVIESVREMVRASREGRAPVPLAGAEEPFWKPEPEPTLPEGPQLDLIRPEAPP